MDIDFSLRFGIIELKNFQDTVCLVYDEFVAIERC